MKPNNHLKTRFFLIPSLAIAVLLEKTAVLMHLLLTDEQLGELAAHFAKMTSKK